MVLLSMHIMARGSVSEDNGWLVCLLNKQIPFLPFKQVSFNFISIQRHTFNTFAVESSQHCLHICIYICNMFTNILRPSEMLWNFLEGSCKKNWRIMKNHKEKIIFELIVLTNRHSASSPALLPGTLKAPQTRIIIRLAREEQTGFLKPRANINIGTKNN